MLKIITMRLGWIIDIKSDEERMKTNQEESYDYEWDCETLTIEESDNNDDEGSSLPTCKNKIIIASK